MVEKKTRRRVFDRRRFLRFELPVMVAIFVVAMFAVWPVPYRGGATIDLEGSSVSAVAVTESNRSRVLVVSEGLFGLQPPKGDGGSVADRDVRGDAASEIGRSNIVAFEVASELVEHHNRRSNIQLVLPADRRVVLPDSGEGSSAGLAMLLALLDVASDGMLFDGVPVTATGTIEDGGEVGAVGGLVEKVPAAFDSGSQWVFVPDELTELPPSDVRARAGDRLWVVGSVSELLSRWCSLRSAVTPGSSSVRVACELAASAEDLWE